MNIAAALTGQARARPEAAALILVDGTRVSFRALDEDSGRIARGLAALGVAPGTRTVLMVPPGADFYPLMFGLFKAGAVPVVVDPGMGVARMRTCLAEARPEAFVGIAKAHAARVFLGLGGPTVRIRIGVGPCWGLGGISLDEVRRRAAGGGTEAVATQPGDPAAILFTSGSTGPPRGAVYTHGNFAAQVEMVRRAFGIEPGEIDLPTFPLFALFDPALGMTTVVPEMDPSRPARADPRRIAKAILDHGVTTMFASPGLLEPLSLHCALEKVRFPSLRRVISAGAPVSPRTVERMAGALPEGGLLHTPYGATEALPVASIDHRAILGETRAKTAGGAGICVGKPVEGTEVRCIRVDDGPIPAWSAGLEVPRGTPGEICVRGPQVTAGYFARPDADALAKIADPAGGPWHRMGDVGYLDDAGRVWFCGRKSQRVRTAEGDLYADQCEAVFNHLVGDVERTALVGVGPRGRQRPLLCVERASLSHESPDDELRSILWKRAAEVELTKGIQDFLFRGPFPVDTRHNAKIQREKLAEWAAKLLSS
jgi:acyl-CoA synthetase (AMP-forming)/AMP-acid ligase II